jgi:hypothetical protein
MSRQFRILIAALILIACDAALPVRALALCSGSGCFYGGFWPPYYYQGVKRFYPRFEDGGPAVMDYPDFYGAFYGTGCVWTRRTVSTPNGPAVAMVPFCASYGALD